MADSRIDFTPESLKTHEGCAELNRMLQFLFDNVAGDGLSRKIYSGYGSPLNVVSADKGSIYMRFDGAGGTTLWVKESGTDGSGWVSK